MKFCEKCKKVYDNSASFCPYCASNLIDVEKDSKLNIKDNETVILNGKNPWSVVGFVFAFLIPILGFIFSIVGLFQIPNYKSSGKALSISGIIISLFVFIITLLVVLATRK